MEALLSGPFECLEHVALCLARQSYNLFTETAAEHQQAAKFSPR